MKITKKMIAVSEKAGACKEALRWASVKPRTTEELWSYRKSWFFWLENILTPHSLNTYGASTQLDWDWMAKLRGVKMLGREWDRQLQIFHLNLKKELIKALEADGWK